MRIRCLVQRLIKSLGHQERCPLATTDGHRSCFFSESDQRPSHPHGPQKQSSWRRRPQVDAYTRHLPEAPEKRVPLK